MTIILFIALHSFEFELILVDAFLHIKNMQFKYNVMVQWTNWIINEINNVNSREE